MSKSLSWWPLFGSIWCDLEKQVALVLGTRFLKLEELLQFNQDGRALRNGVAQPNKLHQEQRVGNFLDSAPYLQEKNDRRSHSIGMMFNPAYNRGRSTRAAISLRNKTFVQGKQANPRADWVEVGARSLAWSKKDGDGWT